MLWRLLQHITAASNMNVGYTTSELCRYAFVDLIWSPAGSQLTQYGKSKLVYCWCSVVDGGPLLKQHWLNVWAGISTELFSLPEILSHFHTLNIPSERMNINEISLRGYEYYRNLPQRVWILPKSPSEGMNITEISLRGYEYYRNLPQRVWILPKYHS